jgi:hypothetical protein
MKALKRACLEKPIGPYLEGTLSGIGDISRFSKNISIKIYSIFRSKKLNYIKDLLTLVHRDFLLLKFL